MKSPLNPVNRFLGRLAILTLPLLSCLAGAQESSESGSNKIFAAPRAAAPPIIDGKLDDAAWEDAAVIDDIHQISPFEYEAPTQRTVYYFTFDSNAIYVAMRAWNEPGGTVARIMRQGAVINSDDRVGIIFDTFNDNRNGYQFELNPHGVRQDGLFKNTSDYATEWDGIWEGKARILDDGWTAEIAIPLKTLSFDPNSDRWGVNFWRQYQRGQEKMGWTSYNRQTNPSNTGTVTGLTGLEQGLGLDITPSFSANGDKEYETGHSSSDFEPSLDVSYKLTPALNGSLTFNTDFSATEVDARQVSLSRFNLFFPEKREFFLRDGDIFEFGRIGTPPGQNFGNSDLENGRPFFSRRIGLDALGAPVDLKYGGKVSGRIGNWNIGTLAIRQDASGEVEETDLIATRISVNVLEESLLGAVFTSGDPRSNLDNTVAGIDFQYNNRRLGGGRSIEVEAWYQQSDTEGIDGDDSAYGLGIAMPNTVGFGGEAKYRKFEQNFNPALGFTSRRGVHEYRLDAKYNWFPRDTYFREIGTTLEFYRYDRIDGDLQSERIGWDPVEIKNQAGDRIKFLVRRNREGLIRDFEISDGVVLVPGLYEYYVYGLIFNTATQRPLSARGWYVGGEFWSGTRNSGQLNLSWRPSPHIFLSAQWTYHDVTLPEGDFETSLANVRFEGVYSASWSWVNILQYDNISDSIGLQSRLHYTPRAGQDAWLVYNHNMVENEEDPGSFRSVRSDLTFKVGYTFRF